MKLFPEEQWREQRQYAMLGEMMSCRVLTHILTACFLREGS